MNRRIGTLLVVLALVGSTLGASVTAADADGPSIAVSVNGDPVTDGDEVVVGDARLDVHVDGATDLATVVVRVDGEDVASYEPTGATMSRSIDPDLEARDNRVQVVATNENGDTRSFVVTIYRDTVPPEIGLSSPFAVKSGYVFPRNVTDIEPNVSVRGTVSDVSTVTDFEVAVYGDGVVRSTTLSNDSTFTLNTTLATGNATLVLRAEDEYGNERRTRTRLEVTDDEAPTISLVDWPETVTNGTVEATLAATDDVGVETITLRPDGHTGQTVLAEPDSLFDAGRDQITRPVTIRLHHPGNYTVRFNATDSANHSTVVEKTVVYDPITPEEAAVPEITVRENATGLVNETTARLNASLTDGSLSRVVVESTATATDRVTSYTVIYAGESNTTRESVTIDRRVPVDGRTEVRIVATDVFGTDHEQVVHLDPENQSHYLTTAAPSSPPTSNAETPTPSRSGTPVASDVNVQTETSLTPVSNTAVPQSPLLVPIAVGLGVAVLWWRRGS